MITKKKQKFVGVQNFIDPISGEVIPMQITEVEDRDFNFHKVWMEHLVMSFQGIINKKLELAFWIINNLDKENKLIGTQRFMSEKTGLSIKTVNETMKLLQSGDIPFLKKINSGAYVVNPDVLFKGSHFNRMGIIFDYSQNVEDKKKSDNKPNMEYHKNYNNNNIKMVAEGKNGNSNYKSDDPNQLELVLEGEHSNGNEGYTGTNQNCKGSKSSSVAI